ncbi:MAG: polyketide synthase dehydratase domain-containing protein, partial [Actinomycetota bacterium]|nr:polyketide synthase dehydratase domain-containing protein [Actinomycetota bacterium]
TVGECDDFGTVGYWVRQVREPVRFADAVERADAARIVEVGPDGSLTAGYDGIAMNPLRAGLSRAWVAGVDVDWAALFPGGRLTDAPTYPFEHRPFWPPAETVAGDLASVGLEAGGHPLLGAVVTLADDTAVVLTGRLSVAAHAWLGDHVIGGTVLVPATALLELAFHAGDAAGCGRVDELIVTTPLDLTATRIVQLVVGARDEHDRRTLTVYSRPDNSDEPWTEHAAGLLSAAPAAAPAAEDDEWPPAGAQPVELTGCYDDFAAHGFAYGPAFQGLRAVWHRDGDVYAEVELPEDVAADAGRFGLHPALLDAAVQAPATVPAGTGEPGRMPFSWSGVTLHAAGATSLRVHLTRHGDSAVTVTATDPDGAPVVTAESLALRELPAATAAADPVHTVGWVPVPANAGEGQTFVTAPGVELRSAVGAALARMQEHLA